MFLAQVDAIMILVNNKIIYCLSIGFLILIIAIVARQFLNQPQKEVIEPKKGVVEEPTTTIANPASVNCEKKGGSLEIRKDKEGNEVGFCLFDDGSECEEWAFFRNECQKGEKICKDLCGDGTCQEIVCEGSGCPCAESSQNCPADCR